MRKIWAVVLCVFFCACAYNPYPRNFETMRKALVEIETVSKTDSGDEIVEEKRFGVGFITDRKEGKVVTNCHIVEPFFQKLNVDIFVRLSDKTICKAVEIDCNETEDISFLKIDCDCSQFAALRMLRGKVKEGDKIIFLDANGKIEGEVEETDIAVTREENGMLSPYIAVTTPFGPGKSGTPILNKNYYVIALASAIMKKGKWVWYLAVPVED